MGRQPERFPFCLFFTFIPHYDIGNTPFQTAAAAPRGGKYYGLHCCGTGGPAAWMMENRPFFRWRQNLKIFLPAKKTGAFRQQNIRPVTSYH